MLNKGGLLRGPTAFLALIASVAAVALVLGTTPSHAAIDPADPVPLPFNLLLHLRSSEQGFLTQTTPPLYPSSFGGSFDIAGYNTPQGHVDLLDLQTTATFQTYNLGDVDSLSVYFIAKLRPSSEAQFKVNDACPGMFALGVTEQGWLSVTTCNGNTPEVHVTQTAISELNGLTFFGIVGDSANNLVTLYVNHTIATHRFPHSFSASPATVLTISGKQQFAEILWSNFDYSYQYINALAVYYFGYYNAGPVVFVEPEISSNPPSSTERPLDTGDDAQDIQDTHGIEGCVGGFTTTTFEECSCGSFGCHRCLLDFDDDGSPLCVECKNNFYLHLQQCVTSCPAGFTAMQSGGAMQCVFNENYDPNNGDNTTAGSSGNGAKTAMVIAVIMCIISIILLIAAVFIYKQHNEKPAVLTTRLIGSGSTTSTLQTKEKPPSSYLERENTIVRSLSGGDILVRGRSYKSNATDWLLPSHNLSAMPNQFNAYAASNNSIARSVALERYDDEEDGGSTRSKATTVSRASTISYNQSDTSTLLDASTYT